MAFFITCRPFGISRNGSEGMRIRCRKCGNKVRIETVSLEKVAAYKGKAQQRKSLLLFLMSLVTGAGLALMGVRICGTCVLPVHSEGSVMATFGDLLDTPPEDIGQYDLTVMNLLCARGLPGAEDLNISECLKTLNSWAEEIKGSTEQKRFVYESNPEQWDYSENWWRVAYLVSYLNRVIGTEYNPRLKGLPAPTHKYDTSFFANSKDVFIHGLLGNQKQGTCASMPVLVVCIGRRMGYPLKLARTPKHLFVKWDDPQSGETFNCEVTDKFAEKKSDSFYMTWPDSLTRAEVERGGYLQSLTPAQELSMFLGFRGLCLWQDKRLSEAQLAFALSHRYDPANPRVPQYVITLLEESWENGLKDGFNNVSVVKYNKNLKESR